MAKLFVVQVVNGNMTTVSEWADDPKGAKVSFHNTCAALWNADDVITGEVKIVDENLDRFEGYSERIVHEETVSDSKSESNDYAAQYESGELSLEQLKKLVADETLTKDEYTEITGKRYVALKTDDDII